MEFYERIYFTKALQLCSADETQEDENSGNTADTGLEPFPFIYADLQTNEGIKNREIIAIVIGTLTGTFLVFAALLYLVKLRKVKHSTIDKAEEIVEMGESFNEKF